MKQISKLLIIPLLLLLPACLPDHGCPGEEPAEYVSLDLEVTLPPTVEGTITSITGTLIHTVSGKKTDFSEAGISVIPFRILEGKYRLELTATVDITAPLKGRAEIAYRDELTLKKDNPLRKECILPYEKPASTLLISEIYYSGSLDERDLQYDEDKFIRITNNSDQLLYLDGLLLAKSALMTVLSYPGITPEVRDTHVPVSNIFRFPGSGTDYPIEPGKTITVCQAAINHQKLNKRAADLSGAHFEWQPAATDLEAIAMQNPAVPDFIDLFDFETFMNNQGGYTYLLLNPGELTNEQILAPEYIYDYKYDFVMEGMEPIPGLMGDRVMKLPNEWVLDAVNTGYKTEFVGYPVSKTLDAGFCQVSDYGSDKADDRYFFSVQRKVASKDGDRTRLQDTDNSSNDFERKRASFLPPCGDNCPK